MAQQLEKLNAKSSQGKDEPLKEAYDLARACAEKMIKMIERKQGRHEELKGIQTKLSAWRKEKDPKLIAKYKLFTERRDVYKHAVNEAVHPDDEGLVEPKQMQGYNVQGMLNAEREMWGIIRTQRTLNNLHPHNTRGAWIESLRQEGHLLISIAQSVSSMSALLFAESAVKEMERKLCDKYWRLAREWQQHVLPPLIGPPLPQWKGMALMEHALSLQKLRENEKTVQNLLYDAWDQLVLVTDKTTRSQLLLTRKDLAESIVNTLKLQADSPSATPAKKEVYVEWKAIFAALSAEWTKLSEATDTTSTLLAFKNLHMEDLFEGNEMPVMGATDAARTLTDAAVESGSIRSLVKPPSSEPIPSLNAALSRVASASSVSTAAASVSASSASSHECAAPPGAVILDPSPNRKRRRIAISDKDEDKENMDITDTTPAAEPEIAPRPAAAMQTPVRRVRVADALPVNSASSAPSVPAGAVTKPSNKQHTAAPRTHHAQQKSQASPHAAIVAS